MNSKLRKIFTADKTLGFFSSFAVLLYIIGLFTFEKESTLMVWRIITIFFITIQILRIIFKRKIEVSFQTVWLIIFYLISLVSSMWAFSYVLSINTADLLLKNVLILFLFINYLESRKKIDFTIKSIVIAGLYLSFYVLFNLDYSTIGEGRFAIEYFNANTVGINVAISVLCCIYLFVVNRNLYYLLITIPLIIVIIISGSRKAFFALVFGVIIFLVVRSKKHKATSIAISLIFILLSFWIVIEVPLLYKILGYRIEGLFSMFSGVGNTESSAMARNMMIEFGWQKFKENPLFGYGIDNYRILFNDYALSSTYSHNNYIELLIGIGFIGTIFYYSMHIFLLGFLSKKINDRDSENVDLIAFSLTLILLILFLDIGMVSYNLKIYQLIIVLIYSAAFIKDKRLSKFVKL
jgi:O-antigen ligase